MSSVSLAEYRKKFAPKAKTKSRRSKYNSKRIEKDGMKFDSAKEYKRYIELIAMMQRGEISELKCQVKFVLAPKVKLEGEKRAKPELRYYADFTYFMNGQLIIEDVKSAATRKLATYRMKKHMLFVVHGISITEV